MPVSGAQGASASKSSSGQATQLVQKLLDGSQKCESRIRFEATGGAQDVDALDELYLVVASNTKHWKVVATQSDLQSDVGVFPASRLSTRHWNSGGQFVGLGAPIQVATGGRQNSCVVNVMSFRAHIEPGDRAGTYAGKIEFTGLVCP